MKQFNVVKYSESYFDQWNDFVAQSKNATFLFHRDFIDYHHDRFEEYSLLVFKNERLIAVLPANRVVDTLHSHQGLSYGGFVVQKELAFSDFINAFKAVLEVLVLKDIQLLKLKLLPRIYESYPSDEMQYLLFKLNAVLYRSDLSSSIAQNQEQPSRSSNRKRGLKKAQKLGLKVMESDDFSDFWNNILIPNLKSRHNAQPVHSLDEIHYLKRKFPNVIRLFCVYNADEVVAGAVIFESQSVAHAQYISANESKQELGSLDLLFDYLITVVYAQKTYFDFGISNENNGQQINQGLLSWKESFGARSVIHQFYAVETQKSMLLNEVLI